MKRFFMPFMLLLISMGVHAQENVTYQKPSKEILELVDVPLAPFVLMDDDKNFMIFLYRDAYKTIEELSQDELRLAGLRINPKTNIGSRVTFYNNVKVQSLANGGEVSQVPGLPDNPKLSNFNWSPDQKKIALTNTTSSGVELWVLDLPSNSLKKLTEANLNANMRDVINWFPDGQALLVTMISDNRKELINSNFIYWLCLRMIPKGYIIALRNIYIFNTQ